ncbi:Flp pilus assembly protein CpaB [Vibrio amylolyticus]|uniref:Flp pilus assembly protein CpaB n=1 Tax=Vibrio amylolyticus TaxID=2847292 RepID=UPI0035530DC1
MKSRIAVYLIFFSLAGAGGWFYLGNQDISSPLTELSNPTSKAIETEVEIAGPELLVAHHTLPRGTLITTEDFKWQKVINFDGDISRTYLKGTMDLSELEGFVVRSKIEVGQPLSPAHFIKPGEHNYLSAVLRPGLRAITIPIDVISGSSGLIKPGNSVDVILSTNQEGQGLRGDELSGLMAKTILSKVRVLAVNQSVENLSEFDAFDVKRYGTATLETSADQAELLTIARKMGELSLSLRSEFSLEETQSRETVVTAGEVIDTFKAPIQSPSLILMHGTKRRNLSVVDSGVEVVAE